MPHWTTDHDRCGDDIDEPTYADDITAHDGAVIAIYRCDPDGTPRGIVQLTHGMGEHVLRYRELADSLTAQGFVVVGQDHAEGLPGGAARGVQRDQ